MCVCVCVCVAGMDGGRSKGAVRGLTLVCESVFWPHDGLKMTTSIRCRGKIFTQHMGHFMGEI